jgi:hypothetical protein
MMGVLEMTIFVDHSILYAGGGGIIAASAPQVTHV